MESKEKSSVLLSIFKRNGAEGVLTKIINASNETQYAKLLERLEKDENGLIVHYEDDLNWFLLTSSKVIINVNGYNSAILSTDLIEVHPAMQEEFTDRIIDMNNFTRLHLRDANGKEYLLRIEKGKPYAGVYQVLHFIASNNKSSE